MADFVNTSLKQKTTAGFWANGSDSTFSESDQTGVFHNMTRALIIDDQQVGINVLSMLLENEGVSIISTTRVEKIDEILKQGRAPDLVFLDLELYNTTGLELLPKLRSHVQLAHAKIIAYTVHTSEIAAAKNAGFDGFLGKPLDAVNFPQVLKQILAGKSVWIA